VGAYNHNGHLEIVLGQYRYFNFDAICLVDVEKSRYRFDVDIIDIVSIPLLKICLERSSITYAVQYLVNLIR